MMGSQSITTPEELPQGCVRLGPLVAYELRGEKLILWHWCDKHLWRRPDSVEELLTPSWVPVDQFSHDVLSLEPLHLEPSVYWPGCCGLHGFIRAGRWVPA